jgi:DNA polymerase-3 subunit delta'
MTTTVDAVTAADPWRTVPGQTAAVQRLRAAVENPVHAYQFVGPEGSGKRAALRAFAGELFASGAPDRAAADRHRRLAAAERHPDLVVIEPEGPVFRGGRGGSDGETEASVVIREAYASPVEADRKVVAAIGFDAANDTAVGALLKTIEEPPERTTIVLVSRRLPPNQTAIASRCVRIDFSTVEASVLRDLLESEGVDPERAALAVTSAAGNVDRARLLATDDRLALRIDAWRAVPGSVDGTGAAATRLAAELLAMVDDALAPVTARHAADLDAFDAEVEAYGITSSTGRRRALTARHKRIERQSRLGELRLGCTVLARAYLDAAIDADEPTALLDAVDRIGEVSRSFGLNPNTELALTALFLGLPPLRSAVG